MLQILAFASVLIILQTFPILSYGQPPLAKRMPIPGSYGGVVEMAFDSTSGEVTGYVYMSSDGPVHRSCSLMFTGIFSGNNKIPVQFFIESQSEKVTDGTLTLKGNNLNIIASSGNGYCNDILDLTDGIDAKLTKSLPYISCKAVQRDKAYIYKSPSDTTKTKMYLIKDNFVMVKKYHGDWANIEYVGKRIIEGWIKKDSLWP